MERVWVLSIVVALVALTPCAYADIRAAASEELSVRFAEGTRLVVCKHIEEYMNEVCTEGPDFISCCSVLAAYEATACGCRAAIDDDGHVQRRGAGDAMRIENAALSERMASISASVCKLDRIGLGSGGACSESRIASVNFPFLLDWVVASSDRQRRRIVDGWVAKTAYDVYNAMDEQGYARNESAVATRCQMMALRTGAECAPTWEDPAAPSSDAQRRLQHILTCCQSLEEMNGEECFCDPDVANALGGPVALKDVGRVSKGACGFHMTFGESCR